MTIEQTAIRHQPDASVATNLRASDFQASGLRDNLSAHLADTSSRHLPALAIADSGHDQVSTTVIGNQKIEYIETKAGATILRRYSSGILVDETTEIGNKSTTKGFNWSTGRLSAITTTKPAADGRAESRTDRFDLDGHLKSSTTEHGNQSVEKQYDTEGKLTRRINTTVSDKGIATSTSYNADGSVESTSTNTPVRHLFYTEHQVVVTDRKGVHHFMGENGDQPDEVKDWLHNNFGGMFH